MKLKTVLSVALPIVATTLLSACHSNIEGKYINPANPQQKLKVFYTKDQWGINAGEPFYEMTETMPCNYRPSTIGVNIEDDTLKNVKDDEVMGKIDGDKITIDWRGCAITYVKK